MKAKVLKPIPGAGYSIGETADFDDLASQWLIEGEYIEVVESKKSKPEKEDKDDSAPETSVKKAPETAAKSNNK